MNGTTSQRFLELLATGDFERLTATLTSDARARFLLPHGLEEYAGRDAVVGRLKTWFGSASVFDLTSLGRKAMELQHSLQITEAEEVVADSGDASSPH